MSTGILPGLVSIVARSELRCVVPVRGSIYRITYSILGPFCSGSQIRLGLPVTRFPAMHHILTTFRCRIRNAHLIPRRASDQHRLPLRRRKCIYYMSHIRRSREHDKIASFDPSASLRAFHHSPNSVSRRDAIGLHCKPLRSWRLLAVSDRPWLAWRRRSLRSPNTTSVSAGWDTIRA